MSYYLTELYAPKATWLALEQADRNAFFDGIATGFTSLVALGIEPIAFGEVDPKFLHASSQQFFAVWRCPDEAAADQLVEGIARSGWHDYFDTVNAAGLGTDLTGHLAQLVALKA